ncbi:cupin domain-containing protein [Alkalihalobacterium alkalinitrilicum]|uniref:cupin domain-containing protein n=1 Tax=Alkalihalobacterium alkalinitrilicum TaxID=427920 RepID=UPI0009957BA5|nr:cupin domain-containing protein [Alkalihalobacterium alkalinitrilicum]
MTVLFIDHSNVKFEVLEGTIGTGEAFITRVVNDEISDSLGGGIVKMENCKFPWTVKYDEIIYVLEGEIIIHDEMKTERMIGKSGDVFFVEKDTPIVYETTSSGAFFFSLYPANWNK